MDDKFPKYASDLVDKLMEDVPVPSCESFGLKAWAQFNDSAVRAMAFMAGQRAIVEALDVWRSEVNDPEHEGDGEDDSLYGSVFGPDGELHSNQSSPHMAGDITPPDAGKPGGNKGH